MRAPSALIVPLLAVVPLGCPLLDKPDSCEENLFVTGELSVDNESFDFDSATAFLTYSAAPGDSDCIFKANIQVKKGGLSSGCWLDVTTTPLLEDAGRLQIDRIELVVNSSGCPTWTVPEGGYTADRADLPLGTVEFNADIKRGDPVDCYDGEMTLELAGFFARDSLINEEVTINASTITVAGMTSPFGEMASCPTPE